MVKILEIGGGRLDAEDDEDCCEIDPAEFAKKVNLKASDDDDVVVVAAKGQIKVKVEVDQSEHSAETLDGHANSNGGLHERIAGDRLDNPYEIEEDDPTIHQMESLGAKPDVKSIPGKPLLVKSDSESPFGEVVADMSRVKCEPEDGNGADERFAETIPDVPRPKSVPDMLLVKCEPEDGTSGADEHELSEEEVIPDMSLLKCDSECFEEVVIPDMPPVKCETEDGAGAVDEPFEEEIIPEDGNGADELIAETIPDVPRPKSVPDMSPVKCEPEDGTSGADEHELSEEEVIPDMQPAKCDSECFEEVVIPDMPPAKCETEDRAGAVDELFEKEIIPGMSLLKCESECFEEVVNPDMSLMKHASGTDELFEEKTIPDMPLLKCDSESFEEVIIPDMSPIKHEPEDDHSADERVGEEDGYDHLPEMGKLNPEGRVFDEEDGDDVVVVAKEAP